MYTTHYQQTAKNIAFFGSLAENQDKIEDIQYKLNTNFTLANVITSVYD